MKEKRRIGIEVQRIFRTKKHGMEVVALELIKEIQKIDESNEYFLYARKDGNEGSLEEKKNFSFRIFAAKSYFTWEQFLLPLNIKKDKIDLLHSTCNTSAIFSNIPLILTLHDIIYLEEINFKGTIYQNFGNLYRKLIVPWLIDKSRIIITVSNYEKEVILKKFKLSNEKVKVIYNAVNSKFNNDYSTEVLEDFRIKTDLPQDFVLFLGNTAPKKNTANVIKAYLDYTNVVENSLPLVILDLDRKTVFNYLDRLGKKESISKFVFPGYISSNNMPLLYNLSKLFLYPSLRESFGLPILEAMACGVPVITSNTSSMPEVAGDAALFVNPLDCNDLKETIVRVLGDEALQKNMKRNGLKRASQFTWKVSAEQLLSIYNSVGL